MRNARDMIKAHKPSIFAVVEPRVSDRIAQRIVKKLSLSKVHIVDLIGFVDGIWIAWDDQDVAVDVIFSSQQVVHCVVKYGVTDLFVLIVIYASLTLKACKRLWLSFKEFAESNNLHWAIAGEFNDVLLMTEKFDGRRPSISRCRLFHDMISSYRLLDLGFQGSPYTW
ncbi:uncharacterized protein LOC120154465 [Hibiscus syriacus]|uniref:uncharacterized protein LOC120154465 n=1 Tax=Hibiscus syriacus TaxID=106335 RepID=UPI0019232C4B|nr:uncharacterized protein LOC120154465 [Hibiscus syriacus]